jgi:hypothetical protein
MWSPRSAQPHCLPLAGVAFHPAAADDWRCPGQFATGYYLRRDGMHWYCHPRVRRRGQVVAEHGQERGLDGSRIAIAGDSVGANMSAAVTLLAKQRGGPVFRQQVLFYPVTDANLGGLRGSGQRLRQDL